MGTMSEFNVVHTINTSFCYNKCYIVDYVQLAHRRTKGNAFVNMTMYL
jgi:hypothetical protein